MSEPDAAVGWHSTELDTPALCVHLEHLDANIATIAGRVRQRKKGWRPHLGSGGCIEIARRMIAAGASGLTVSTLSAAEACSGFAGNVPEVLIQRAVVGPQKLHRLVGRIPAAARIVAIDHFVHAEELDRACRQANVRCRVVVEIDLGLHRTGVRPGPDAQQLLRGIRAFPNIDVIGLSGSAAHLATIPDPAEKERLVRSAMGILGETADRMRRDGLQCDVVSAGETATLEFAADCPEPTELRCGGGIFGDPFYAESCGVTGLVPAVFVLGTVIHRGKLERAVLDCGQTAFDHGSRVARVAGGPAIPDARITALGGETTQLELGPEGANLRIGDRVEIVPGSSRYTIAKHDRIHALRGGVVAEVWPVAPRWLS